MELDREWYFHWRNITGDSRCLWVHCKIRHVTSQGWNVLAGRQRWITMKQSWFNVTELNQLWFKVVFPAEGHIPTAKIKINTAICAFRSKPIPIAESFWAVSLKRWLTYLRIMNTQTSLHMEKISSLVRLNIFYCRKTKGLDTSYKQHYIVLSLNVTSNLQMVQQ